MSTLKRILKRKEAQIMGAWVGAWWIRVVARTTRWEVRMPDSIKRITENAEPYIGVFWHGRMMMMHHAWPRRGRIHMLISAHRDGLLVSRMIARLGFPTLAGSTRKGGMTALRAMKRLLAAGDCVGITPDGPRGPRMRVKPGTIKVAQWTGRPIVGGKEMSGNEQPSVNPANTDEVVGICHQASPAREDEPCESDGCGPSIFVWPAIGAEVASRWTK